jgi:hypothetical protein
MRRIANDLFPESIGARKIPYKTAVSGGDVLELRIRHAQEV